MPGENRKSFRILTPVGREKGTLRLGKKQVSVRLVDESAGGYAIACKGEVKAVLGDVLQLRTSGGLHEVKVIRREEFSDGVLIGLSRLRDLDDPQAPQVQSSCFDYLVSPYIAGGPVGGGGGFRFGWILGLLALGALLLVAGNFLANYRPPRMGANVLPVSDQTARMMTDKARQAAADQQARIEAARLGGNRNTNTSQGFNLSRHWRQASGRIAASLGLSAEQRKQIDEIAGKGGDTDAQIRQVLSSQQAEKWRQLAH